MKYLVSLVCVIQDPKPLSCFDFPCLQHIILSDTVLSKKCCFPILRIYLSFVDIHLSSKLQTFTGPRGFYSKLTTYLSFVLAPILFYIFEESYCHFNTQLLRACILLSFYTLLHRTLAMSILIWSLAECIWQLIVHAV
jgi:hypothetical protein